MLRIVREERDVHGGGLLEVVEVHPQAGLYGLQAAVEGGPGDVVELGGAGLVAAGGR